MQIDSKQILDVLSAADHALGVKEVMGRLGVHPGELTDMKRALRDLVREGAVLRDGKRFRPATDKGRELPVPRRHGARHGEPGQAQPQAKPVLIYPNDAEGQRRRRGGGPQTVVGLLRKHRDGFGFVERYDGEGDDIFVPAVEATQAFDGDLIRVQVIPGTGGRTQGRIVETVERRRTLALGTYVQRGRQTMVVPMDASLGEFIAVQPDGRVRDGDVVKVQLTEPGAPGFVPPQGVVLEKAGERGEPQLEVLRAAYAQGFSDEFPESVIAYAEQVARPVEPSAYAGRRDLRGLNLVTIDGEDARDFDDAVYVERAPRGYRLVVAIADVSHYVTEGSALDDEALRRCTSVYFPNLVLPMLPEALSNGICSLRPDEERLCMVADMIIDEAGLPIEAEIYAGVMRSRARCTYTEVAALLSGEKVPDREFLRADLELGHELAKKLNRARMDRGAIDFDIPEAKVVLDEASRVRTVERRERNEAHKLVEEFMLAANEAVARYFGSRGLPTIYRVHGEPDEDKLAAFLEFAQVHGLRGAGSEVTPKALNAMLHAVEGKPVQRAFNSLLLRAMMQATYEAENIGHYGLAAENYLHFTSPIRRYPDLVVHRLLKEHWARGKATQLEAQTARLAAIARRCSERERGAMKAEREVDAYFGCLFLKERLGQRYPGIIASVAEFGLFVELEGLFVEGLVKAEDLGGQADLDLATQSLRFPSGRSFSVGDRIEVQIRSVNLERRQTDLALVELGKLVHEGERPRTLADAVDRIRGGGRGREPTAGSRGFSRGGGSRGREPAPTKRNPSASGKRGGGKPSSGKPGRRR